MNKDKKVRLAEPITSSSNIPKQTDSLKTQDSNKPLLPSTGVNTTTSARGSKPSGNTKKNRITRPPSSNQKNKVEEHPRKVKSSLNKMNSVSEPISLKTNLGFGIEMISLNIDYITSLAKQAMASEQFSSGPGTQLLPHETISLGLVQNIPSPTPYVPPTKNDWDTLFQPMFDEYLNHPPS
ncbi:hypothetical protein Tco_0267724 [Tanacetum coccineum]